MNKDPKTSAWSFPTTQTSLCSRKTHQGAQGASQNLLAHSLDTYQLTMRDVGRRKGLLELGSVWTPVIPTLG